MSPAQILSDNSAITRPMGHPRGMDSFQQIRITRVPKLAKNRWRFPQIIFGLCVLVTLMYFFAPVRTNVLILGIDGGLGRGELGRTDTFIITTVLPFRPYIGLLSIPRDLWVPIEGLGENRINTAYFFAEAGQPGSGGVSTLEVVRQNFRVPVNDYIILRMDGMLALIDAMGGVDISLSKPLAGYPAGNTHLDGATALGFVRSREGTDDFSRMEQGQILIKAVMKRITSPQSWRHLPEIIASTRNVVNSNIPLWQWPRLGLAFLRVGQENIDTRSIMREMVMPFTTSQGAQVLEPNWQLIDKVTEEMFGK